jgi:hypothetical protein
MEDFKFASIHPPCGHLLGHSDLLLRASATILALPE